MIKFGCVAVAIACSLVAPAAQAQGDFFVAGQAGRATYDDSRFEQDEANTRAISGGYRWQAGPVTQVGFEVGAGKVDEVGDGYTYYYDGGVFESWHVGAEATYRHVGANARFNFGQDSRWFAIARGGYMRYEQTLRSSYYSIYIGEPSFDSERHNDSGAYFGAGIGFDISKNVNVNVMVNGYAYSEVDGDADDDGIYEGMDADVGTACTTTFGVEVRF